MAQRTVHYVIGEILSDHVSLVNKERFLLGSILPDAIQACDRDKSHFKVRTDTLSYYDFEAFRNTYSERIRQDDLYLGYYMHLVEDAFYRTFIYQDCFIMPRSPEEVRLLHHDYHILNPYIVSKYKIHNILQTNISLEQEPVCRIANFLIDDMLEELAHDFAEETDGSTVFLTESMLDTFMETYIPLAVDELRNIKKGTPMLQTKDYTWPRKR